MTQTPRGMKVKPYDNVTEQMKWRNNENVTSVFFKVENESFTPLVFSINVRMRQAMNVTLGSPKK